MNIITRWMISPPRRGKWLLSTGRAEMGVISEQDLERDPEHRVEGPITRLHPHVSAEHDEGVRDRVEDRLGVFTLINCLTYACAIVPRQPVCAENLIRVGGVRELAILAVRSR